MLTSKERAHLRGLSNNMDTIFQIGKGGITEATIASVKDALYARELIKLRVLDNSFMTAREAATEIAESVGADVVSCVGSRFVLYKRSDNKKIDHIEF